MTGMSWLELGLVLAELVKEKKIEGISELRDESDKDGMRIVITLKRDAIPNVVLNQLYKHTAMQTTFGVIMLALDKGAPKVVDYELEWDPCPGDQFQVIRGDATFAQCMAKYDVGELVHDGGVLPAFVVGLLVVLVVALALAHPDNERERGLLLGLHLTPQLPFLSTRPTEHLRAA